LQLLGSGVLTSGSQLAFCCVLRRLSDGFSAAAAANKASKAVADGAGQSSSAFLQRRPTDLLVHQVEQLQQQYQHLLLRNAA
jgi:hypothetical protein